MPRNKLTWTQPMLNTLHSERAGNTPVLLCAEIIGVGYAAALLKARELDIADRRNRGRLSGPEVYRRKLYQRPRGK